MSTQDDGIKEFWEGELKRVVLREEEENLKQPVKQARDEEMKEHEVARKGKSCYYNINAQGEKREV